MADPHGDAGHGGNAQAVTQTQCNVLSKTEDLDIEVLNHVLEQVLENFSQWTQM